MKIIRNWLLTIFCIFFVTLTPQLSASGDGDIAIIEGVVPISISDAKKLMTQDNVYIFDANEEKIREELGYIHGAVHINLDGWQNLLPKNKDATLIFYCQNRTCFTSSEAALEAMKLGYKNSYVMLEGIENWIIKGNPVVKPSKDILIKNSKNATSKASWLESSDVDDYADKVHSHMIFGKVPACRDCHGVDTGLDRNQIRAQMAISKDNVNNNCASCHSDIAKEFKGSVHDFKTTLNDRSPSCSDCHAIHTGASTAFINVRKQSDERCGSCHKEEQAHYHETFHGKVVRLDDPNAITTAAACSDCHGAHNVFKIDDKRSTLFLGNNNRIDTCAKCHDNVNENFAEFIAHADHTNKDKFPVLFWTYVFMTGLIIAVFGFFGFHTFLWSVKLISTRLKHPKEWKEAKEKAASDPVAIRRFSAFHMWQHFFMAASFLGLSFSGLPQKFSTASWAQSMIDMMGGPIMATKIHHISAIVMIVVFLSHILEVLINAWCKRDAIRNPQTGKMELSRFWSKFFGPDSLFPRWQDFKDMKNHFLWFFGKGERPQFDRWTYWEKFDYLAVFWGMFIIGLSGLMLWFPTWFTQYLPGWSLNLATLLHSDEALLATGFIFAIHFFNTHFRADRFPMDMVIFSGTFTKEEIKHERKPWYDRLVESGKIESLEVKDSNFKSWSWLAKLAGFAMLITGMIFLFMIIYAFAEVLFF